MMLASPLLPAPPSFSPQHASEDALQYRPSRDIDAFNNLLPPPIEFIEGSSSGTLAVAEGKYEPINSSPRIQKVDRHEPSSTPVKTAKTPSTPSAGKATSLFIGGVDSTWPATCNRATGLYNSGNTCFLNSALQCLLHTPPLLRVLLSHSKDLCRVSGAFCMVCNLRQVAVQAHGTKSAFSPSPISNRLQTIAKHMRKGRQEDSHEFLRYAIDALQKSCLAGHPPKMDPKLAETTWVHKIFGGQLRSRVTCRDCGHNSDTFDRILDLSLDIYKSDALKDALRKFIAVDYLKGADKYKCEKCKKHVIAEKRFTIHEAPMILTVHLKRFSPLGKKIGHHVNYDDSLTLHPYMSEGHYGPSYSLYGVICHAGGGPNSGHYFSYIKSKDGRWWEMNDESVSSIGGAPVNKKNAYMLFYMRNKGQELEAAVKPMAQQLTTPRRNGIAAGMKKRRERDEDEVEDQGVKVSKPFIGPLLPSPTINGEASGAKRQKLTSSDPQATLVKKKIQAAASADAKRALQSLAGYASGSDEESGKEGEGVTEELRKWSSPPLPPSSSPLAVPPSSFYGPGKKRKSPDSDESEQESTRQQRPGSRPNGHYGGPRKSVLGPALNPFSRLASGNQATYSKKHDKRRWTMSRRGI